MNSVLLIMLFIQFAVAVYFIGQIIRIGKEIYQINMRLAKIKAEQQERQRRMEIFKIVK